MKVIPREARRITYSTEIRNLKKRLFLSDYQRSLVVGSILGDGGLYANWSKTNYCLRINHSIKQKEYLLWKRNILRKWVITEPNVYRRTQSIRLGTISHRELTELRGIFYKENKKIIPGDIDRFLNPLAIAIWFMDDGNIRKNNGKIYGYYINSQSFTEKENRYLAEVIKRKFGINCLILKNHGKYRLYIGIDRNKFTKLIRKFIVPSMSYKLG